MQDEKNGQVDSAEQAKERIAACEREINEAFARYMCKWAVVRQEVDGVMGPFQLVILSR